jgi:hypothetical protein
MIEPIKKQFESIDKARIKDPDDAMAFANIFIGLIKMAETTIAILVDCYALAEEGPEKYEISSKLDEIIAMKHYSEQALKGTNHGNN